MVKTKRVLYCILLAIVCMAVGAAAILLIEVHVLDSRAPGGPAQAKGLEGRYYNWVYALSPCSSAPLERYEDENVGFRNLSYKDAPDMERHSSSYDEKKPLAVTLLRYSQGKSLSAGNIYIDTYKPKERKPAGLEELKEFVEKYAEENIGPQPVINYGCVQGAPFSADFRSGAREGVCFTDTRGGLYCFKDQNMAMQRGGDPFFPTLLHSLGMGTYSLDDYAVYGLKDWFTRPSREKSSECNFTEIKRTIFVRAKR